MFLLTVFHFISFLLSKFWLVVAIVTAQLHSSSYSSHFILQVIRCFDLFIYLCILLLSLHRNCNCRPFCLLVHFDDCVSVFRSLSVCLSTFLLSFIDVTHFRCSHTTHMHTAIIQFHYCLSCALLPCFCFVVLCHFQHYYRIFRCFSCCLITKKKNRKNYADFLRLRPT